MKKIKISFVGVGFMSQIAHIINYYKNKKVELYEVCDLDENLAKEVKKKFNFTGKIYKDYTKMDTKNVDGVVIIVQRRLLEKITGYFLKNNCNVFSEKPHSYSLNEYKKNKKNQKKVWLKGYVRRHDTAIKKFKKNYLIKKNNLGKLNSISYYVSSGNSYLGAKHFVNPFIKKEFKSPLSKFPKFIKKKNYKLYDIYANTALHSIDLFDFFEMKFVDILFAQIDDNNFLCNFTTLTKIQKEKILCQIFLNSSPNQLWDEKMIFMYEKGQVIIKFNSPLFKKGSHKITIFNKLKNETTNISFKNKWCFNQQTLDFVNYIEKKNYFNFNSLSGKDCIKNYENIWKFYINKKNKI